MNDKALSLPVIQEAASDLHAHVRTTLLALCRSDPSLDDITEVLGQSYGEALGLSVLAGHTAQRFMDLNEKVERAANAIMRDVSDAASEL